MMELQKRKLVQVILGFFLGRVSLFGINPIGIAFFASGYMETGIRLPLGISVILGMVTVFPMENVLCHMMVMLALVGTIDFLEKRKVPVQMLQTMLILLLALVAVTFFRIALFSYDFHEKLEVMIECVLSVAATRLLYDGQHFLLTRSKGQYPGNEELLSMVLLGMFVALGMPDVNLWGVTPVRLAIYFFILLIGYCYGTGAGALAGTVGGLCLMTLEENAEMIGVMALMGIVAGHLRSRRKAVLCIGYFWGIMICSFFIGASRFPYADFIHAGLSGVCFFFLPDRVFEKVKMHSGMWEDYWESEKLQEMIQYKLIDFSKVFYRLSEILGKESLFDGVDGPNGAREVLAATSEQVCGQCDHAGNCGGQLALFNEDNLSEIAASGMDVQVKAEKMPREFKRECVHQDYFLWEVNQNIHMANTIHYFRNQLFYHQQVTAEQMQEIGAILENLSEQMPKILKIPQQIREKLERELKKARIKLDKTAFYEKHDGRMEIHMTARTARGRCVTTREAEKLLSEVLGISVRVHEACRKVFPLQMEEFVFIETVRLKAETGVSRLAKGTERVSGDTFSRLELSEGEMLLALSDGMGSGSGAYEESEKVIELLEQMTEAGFSERSSVKLVNSLYLSGEPGRSFATADMTLVDLYQETAHFVKCGASTTYLYHDKKLIPVEGEALPIGVMGGLEPYMMKSGISAGDYVIMMTDGVSDSFSMEKEELGTLLWDMIDKNYGAQDFSERLLEDAVARWGGRPEDDMSVLVLKLF